MEEPNGHGQKVLGLMIHYYSLVQSHETLDTMDFDLLCFVLFCVLLGVEVNM